MGLPIAPVAQTFFADERVSDKYNLDGIITVVDAKHIEQHLDDEKPKALKMSLLTAFADIMNKIDLVDHQELATSKHASNPSMSDLPDGKQHHDEELNIEAFDLEKTLDMDPDSSTSMQNISTTSA